MSHTHIELDATSLPPADAEMALSKLLAAYGKTVTPQLRSGAEVMTITDTHGVQAQVTYAELLTELHLTGTCELHRVRWQDTDPYGSVSLVIPEGMPPVIIGTGPRNSPPLHGPGYATNDVVAEMLDDVLHFRRQVASLSHESDMFRAAFRAYRYYLAACISSIDAFLNRLSWFARNDSPTPLPQTDVTLLSRKSLPLDEKFRQWLPVVAAGQTISETSQSWSDYQSIRNARNAVVHVNEPDFLFALREAADVLNLCRHGVGDLLIEVGTLLGRNPAPTVLRVASAPLARFIPKK